MSTRSSLDRMKNAILLTLAYSEQFSYPLTEVELWRRLFSLKEKAVFSQKVFLQVLKDLTKSGQVIEEKGYLYLKGSGKLVRERLRKTQLSRKKWREVQRFVVKAKYIPWISAVFVTGSLAMNNVEKDSDCDFLIITQPKRLWLSRVLVIGIAWLAGRRRSWAGEEKNSWCFNLWLDEEHLTTPSEIRSVYTAYEVIQAVLVFERRFVGIRFWEKNAWVKNVLPNWEFPTQKLQGLFQNNIVFSFVDYVLWKFQLWYMQPHRTSEKIGRGYAFFHPRDTKTIIMRGWKNVARKHRLNTEELPHD